MYVKKGIGNICRICMRFDYYIYKRFYKNIFLIDFDIRYQKYWCIIYRDTYLIYITC